MPLRSWPVIAEPRPNVTSSEGRAATMSEGQESRLVRVYTASNQLEAQVIKGKLESEGITALLQHESQVFGLTVDGMGEVRILVPEHLAQRAHEIVTDTEP